MSTEDERKALSRSRARLLALKQHSIARQEAPADTVFTRGVGIPPAKRYPRHAID